MAGDEFDALHSLQKDEEITKLKAKLSKTTIEYWEALKKKLEYTEDLVATLESQEHNLKEEIRLYKERTNEAKMEHQLEMQNLEACNLALHAKEAAYEKLEKSLEVAKRKAEDDIEFQRKECEEMNTTNKTLLKELLDARRQTQLLENDLSDARRENKQLREELNQATDTNLMGSDNAVVSVDNSKTDPPCVDTNGINEDNTSSPPDHSNDNLNETPLNQELLELAADSEDNEMSYYPSLCSGDPDVTETANKSAEIADIPSRRRGVFGTPGFPPQSEGQHSDTQVPKEEGRADSTFKKRKGTSQKKGGYAYKKPKIEHPTNLERTEGVPTRGQHRHGTTSVGGNAAPRDFTFTFCASPPGFKNAQPVSTGPGSAATYATAGQNAWPERSDSVSAGP
ncbi:hypothetical protein T440DRAFT_523802 [Plenodomus tracheiphilus IPT5]|uniref:Uncharacterized protein n=1 Tax=Plenodomus tracheiphilus IPT5 TaxID=1408161 RepID=A0A6A7ALQ5_9PLEO|nr:hypothetical protein T440DRAFT_523802 [Plenodomus tracheiphilus IPT5]